MNMSLFSIIIITIISIVRIVIVAISKGQDYHHKFSEVTFRWPATRSLNKLIYIVCKYHGPIYILSGNIKEKYAFKSRLNDYQYSESMFVQYLKLRYKDVTRKFYRFSFCHRNIRNDAVNSTQMWHVILHGCGIFCEVDDGLNTFASCERLACYVVYKIMPLNIYVYE